MEGKRVVVTGGAGFIGSSLSERLSERNEVVILDNFSTGKRENIEDLIKKENVRLIEGNVTDLELLKTIFQDIDYIFHQAALPSVPRSVENPVATNDVNINGTLNVLVAARDTGVRKVVYASSSSVYGDTLVLPKTEDMIPGPLSPYAVSKLAGEYYCRVFHDVYGLPTSSLRYFNVYGPRQDPGSEYAAVVPKFITRVGGNQSPLIYGDGEQTRDFTFIGDVVEANILAAGDGGSNGRVLNIAGGRRTTVNNLSEMIVNLMGKDLRAEHTDPRPGDIKHSLADISKAGELLNWKPRTSLDQGLKETIDFFTGRCEDA